MIKFLDCFCGKGSVSNAFKKVFPDSYIVGIDNTDRSYPYQFYKMNFEDISESFLNTFDILWASPPCQKYSKRTPSLNKSLFPDLIPLVRYRFKQANKIYFIENVPSSPLQNPIILNGKMFGRNFYHARWFETNLFVLTPKIIHTSIKNNFPFKSPGKSYNNEIGFKRSSDWAKRNSVPLVYTEFLFNELKRQKTWKIQ